MITYETVATDIEQACVFLSANAGWVFLAVLAIAILLLHRTENKASKFHDSYYGKCYSAPIIKKKPKAISAPKAKPAKKKAKAKPKGKKRVRSH